MSQILIVEDEAIIRASLRRLLEREGHDVLEAPAVNEALELCDISNMDLVVSDLRLPGAPGTELIQHAGDVPVLIMTSYASVRSAVDAMKLGAADYIAKPYDNDEMRVVVKRLLQQHKQARQHASLKSDVFAQYPVNGMIGSSAAMQQVSQHIHKIAPTDATVLIVGESGTGKELVARALHELSQRREGPVIAVNCAAIPDTLIESELFGHEKGAFTGATQTRAGLVEAADGGTLFLDEIGELPLEAQARLLRVLQEGEIRRVGSTRMRRADVRLVAATHRDLKQMVADKHFREDLYFRLHVMQIDLPPLRERGEDIDELARALLEKTCRRLNRPPLLLDQAALDHMRCYHWPGNVREMENAIERAVILADGERVTAELLALEPQPADATIESDNGASLEHYMRQFVINNQDNMTETELAKQLGISRKTLWEKRQRLGIPRSRKS